MGLYRCGIGRKISRSGTVGYYGAAVEIAGTINGVICGDTAFLKITTTLPTGDSSEFPYLSNLALSGVIGNNITINEGLVKYPATAPADTTGYGGVVCIFANGGYIGRIFNTSGVGGGWSLSQIGGLTVTVFLTASVS